MYTVCVAQYAVAAVLYRCCADARSAGRPVSRFVHSRSDVCYSAAFDVTLIYYVVGFHIFYQT